MAHPVLMGIVNVTPNSFSDGGRFIAPAGDDFPAAVNFGEKLVREGAALLDIGGEASSFFRPGVTPVDPPEQIRRVLPVINGLAAINLRRADEAALPVILSVDTRSSAVARAAVGAGAHMVNDISAGCDDPAMLDTVAESGAMIVLMHRREERPGIPPKQYKDVCTETRDFLGRRAEAAVTAGIGRKKIFVDPGVGFGKTPEDNWKLVARIEHLVAAGYPVVLGASRKRFLAWQVAGEALTNGENSNDSAQRDEATALVTALAAAKGVRIHRVHDVSRCAAALRILRRFQELER